ncbi:hypothetical protein HOH45_05310 [bacterium]|nr:hypothetical protein [bacterium]
MIYKQLAFASKDTTSINKRSRHDISPNLNGTMELQILSYLNPFELGNFFLTGHNQIEQQEQAHRESMLKKVWGSLLINLGLGKEQVESMTSSSIKSIYIDYTTCTIERCIKNRIDGIEETRTLDLSRSILTTGQLLKIINDLTPPQKNALTVLTLSDGTNPSLPSRVEAQPLEFLPSSIKDFVNLKTLTINDRHLDIPKTIGTLVKLTQLTLNNIGLKSVPDGISSLVNLTGLTLSRNPLLTSLPIEIESLVNLTSLCLDGLTNLNVAELPSLRGLLRLRWLNLEETIFILDNQPQWLKDYDSDDTTRLFTTDTEGSSSEDDKGYETN